MAKDEETQFRLRYRITAEKPIHKKLDCSNTFYIKFHNEYLNSWQDNDYDIEIRLIPLIGYDIQGTNKIEAGVDYRINSFINDATRHSFWLSLNWSIEI